MPQRGRFSSQRQRARQAAAAAPAPVLRRPERAAPLPPVEYGAPFIVLEDNNKVTYVYKAGDWVTYPMSIAECRRDCKVTELSQKLKDMTRYEVRCPIDRSK